MDGHQRKYYDDMQRRDRSYLVIKDGHLVGVLTYWIGDDDNKYLYGREPWTMLEDEPRGSTVYIDQLLTRHMTHAFIHREFTKILEDITRKFPNVEKVKWVRAPANFRKNKVRGGRPHVHCKHIAVGRVRQAAL